MTLLIITSSMQWSHVMSTVQFYHDVFTARYDVFTVTVWDNLKVCFTKICSIIISSNVWRVENGDFLRGLWTALILLIVHCMGR